MIAVSIVCTLSFRIRRILVPLSLSSCHNKEINITMENIQMVKQNPDQIKKKCHIGRWILFHISNSAIIDRMKYPLFIGHPANRANIS